MALKPIPKKWRENVCAILKTMDSKKIRFTDTAFRRFEADFFDSWSYELYLAFCSRLGEEGIEGCPISMKPPPPGETWEFFFWMKGRKAYGKILLRSDRQGLLIHSAHLPTKPRLSCDHG